MTGREVSSRARAAHAPPGHFAGASSPRHSARASHPVVLRERLHPVIPLERSDEESQVVVQGHSRSGSGAEAVLRRGVWILRQAQNDELRGIEWREGG